MSISEDMLADKLKGYTFNMSQYQYMEVHSHIDPEMQYIVAEVVYKHITAQVNDTYHLYPFFKMLVRAVIGVMYEREKVDNSINGVNSDRIESIIWNKYEAVCTKSDSALSIAIKMLPYIINDTLVQIRYINL